MIETVVGIVSFVGGVTFIVLSKLIKDYAVDSECRWKLSNIKRSIKKKISREHKNENENEE